MTWNYETDTLLTITETGTYNIDFSKYKYIVFYLVAYNVWGESRIINTNLIKNNITCIPCMVIKAGIFYNSIYNATAIVTFDAVNKITVQELISGGENVRLLVMSID